MNPAFPIRLELMGAPRIVDGGGQDVAIPVGKPLALLAYLHLEGEPVARSTLADFFWPDASPKKARASLRQALWLLRKGLGEDLFLSDEPVGLAPGKVDSDLRDLLEEVGTGASLNRILEVWTDPPFRHLLLPDLPDWQRWTDRVRTEAEHIVASALMEKARSAENPEASLPLLEAASTIQPENATVRLALIDAVILDRDFERAEILILRTREAFPEDDATHEALEVRSARLHQLRREPYDTVDGPRALHLDFVGRTEEYSALVHRWREARGGKARRVLLSGEAGIGKSRLASQVSVFARTEGARTVWVKAEDGEETLGWSYLSEVLRKLLRLSGAAGIGRDSDRVLRTLLPGLGSNGGVDGGGGSPAPIGEPTEAAIAESLHDLLAAVSEDAPLVLALDDLQWVDPKSRSVILRTVRRLEREPVLALITCRSGIHDANLRRAIRLLEESDGFLRVDLAPLSESEVREAVTLLVEFSRESGADEVLRRIYQLSRGNPLFLIEVLESLQERGVLEADPEGEWILKIERFPDDLPLPSSVRELLDRKLQDLSPGAVGILEVLLGARQPLPPPELQRRSDLGPAAFSPALHALLERGVLAWTPEDALTFAHDEVQAVARTRFEPEDDGGGPGRRVNPIWVAVVAVAALLVLSVAGLFLSPWSPVGTAAAPPGGGGALYLVYGDEAVEVRPDAGPPGDWAVGTVSTVEVRGSIVRGVHRMADGALGWFLREANPEDAPWIAVRRAGREDEVLVRTPGDDFFLDLFPDGRTVLYASEDRTAPSYRHALHRLDLETGTSERIPNTLGLRTHARVSVDGRRILAMGLDTLHVLTPTGGRVRSVVIPGLGRAEWCGGRQEVAVYTVETEGPELRILDLPTGHLESLPLVGLPGTRFSCSPDGTFLAYPAISDRGTEYVVLNRETLETSVLAAPGNQGAEIFWAGEGLVPVPERLLLSASVNRDDAVVLSWGGVTSLAPTLVRSDGSRTPVSADFESDQPGVASVTSDGRVFANSPGRAVIRGTWDGWLDTRIEVEVEGEARDGTLFEDRFETVDPEAWRYVGFPTPVAVEYDGARALRLRGDGRHTDGVLRSEAEAFPAGATAEMEFRVPLSRPDRQDVELCLIDGDLPTETADGVEWFHLTMREYVCVRYPGRNLQSFDAGQAGWRNHLFGVLPIDVASHLPTDDWSHLALQLRADGEVSAYLNGDFIGRFPVRLQNTPETLWRFGIFGHSVDTEVHVRNFAIWPGMRY